MPHSLAALTIVLLVAMVLVRALLMKRQGIRAILFGPVPGDDAALVRLATDLDALEGQVTQ